jgi:hypothetical protein
MLLQQLLLVLFHSFGIGHLQAAGIQVKDKSAWTILAPTDATFTARLNTSLGITPAELLKPDKRDTLEEVRWISTTKAKLVSVDWGLHAARCFVAILQAYDMRQTGNAPPPPRGALLNWQPAT